MTFLSGFIAIVGPSNVGKSTLLNRILGSKLAIVSPKPQTTRNRITGVYHGDGCQMVFLDTPGIHKTRSALHKSMVQSALAAFHEVDMILMMIQMDSPDDPAVSTILDNLRGTKKPCHLVINKIDRGSKNQILPIIENLGKGFSFETIVPISALKGDGVDLLLQELKTSLRPGPRFFPEEMQTDQPEIFFVCEMIREKTYLHMRQGLPYSCAVTVQSFEENPNKNLISIAARLHVESKSQKGIFIGQGGRMIKAIGRSARVNLEKFLGSRVHLDLTVRVEKDWTSDPKALRRLGY